MDMANSDKSKKSPSEAKSIQVMSDPIKLIPKFATKIGGAKAGSTYVLSFMAGLTDETPQMIERISIDEKNVDELIELLKSLKELNNAK